jgi:hypothetical protein
VVRAVPHGLGRPKRRALPWHAREGAGKGQVVPGCARPQWPPLVLPRGARRPVAGPGVNPALLGTVRRVGGSLQVTYNRWPQYLWQGDFAAGQATG